MAKLILCGLESKPKLNGRDVQIVKYHSDRGRWEVELDGDLPMVDLFRIDWNDSWFEPYDDEKASPWKKEKETPLFKDILEEKLEKFKVAAIRAELTVLDCNGRKVWVLDGEGSVSESLTGKYIPRKADNGAVSRNSFPLQFQKSPQGGKTLAVRPCCLRVREDEDVERLRKRKVEMSVGATHKKPELDGKMGELGPFQASSFRWSVCPDMRSLWDVKVDGSPCPVPLCSAELCDETSGAQLCDPVRIAAWDRVEGERALYATVGFRRGQVILEDEPAMYNRWNRREDLADLWQQFMHMPWERREAVRDLRMSASDRLRRFPRPHMDGVGSRREPTAELVQRSALETEDFNGIVPGDRDAAWNLLRVFDTNHLTHAYTEARLLYLALARVNHSCAPNAILVDPMREKDSHDPLKKVLIALRDIDKGEEITVSYLSNDALLEPFALRRQQLGHWGFACACRRCADEDEEGLFRRFSCKNGCGGVHLARLKGVRPCDSCGFEATDVDRILSEEEMHISAYTELMRKLSPENPLPTADPLVQIVEVATQGGLAPEHWVVCKARDVLSIYYQTLRRPDLAALNLEPILALEERALGSRGWQRLEAFADLLMAQGFFAEAFCNYAAALQAARRTSPELPAGSSSRCDRIRKKLRGAIDAKTPDAGEAQ